MSVSSERKAMGETLAAYSLVSAAVAAKFLDVSTPTVHELRRDGVLPAVPVGAQWKFDPLDLAVHVLAAREGVGRATYWERHGEATPEHARRYVARIRKLQAEAA